MVRLRRVGASRSSHRRECSPVKVSSHFFKVMLPSTIHDKRLKIPVKFVREFGKGLSAIARVTVPNGLAWRVGLEKADNNIWFHEGWQEFVEYHSIREWDFLVFRYAGNSNFHVLIFDMTACEVNYPCTGLGSDEEHNLGAQCTKYHKEKLEDDDDSVEILGSTSHRSLKNRDSDEYVDQKTLGKRYKPGKRAASSEYKQGKRAASSERANFNHGYMSKLKKCKMEVEGEMIELDYVNEFRQYKTNKNKMPSLFERTMEKNQCPSKYAEDSHAPVPSLGDKGLQIGQSKLKKSTSKANEKHQHTTKNACVVQPATRSSQGTDVQCNESKPGRTKCNEEMFSTRRLSRTSSKRRPVTTQERERAIHAARMFKPKNPYFMIILRPHNIYNYHVYVPAGFAKKYMHGVSEYIKAKASDGREWPVQCLRRDSAGMDIGKGWGKFSRENKLEEGDVCVFELIEPKGDVLKVSIFRVVEDVGSVN